MNCQLILTNKVCAAVLLLWVMEAMFNRILFCCNGHQGTVLRFVEIVTIKNIFGMKSNSFAHGTHMIVCRILGPVIS